MASVGGGWDVGGGVWVGRLVINFSGRNGSVLLCVCLNDVLTNNLFYQ